MKKKLITLFLVLILSTMIVSAKQDYLRGPYQDYEDGKARVHLNYKTIYKAIRTYTSVRFYKQGFSWRVRLKGNADILQDDSEYLIYKARADLFTYVNHQRSKEYTEVTITIDKKDNLVHVQTSYEGKELKGIKVF